MFERLSGVREFMHFDRSMDEHRSSLSWSIGAINRIVRTAASANAKRPPRDTVVLSFSLNEIRINARLVAASEINKNMKLANMQYLAF